MANEAHDGRTPETTPISRRAAVGGIIGAGTLGMLSSTASARLLDEGELGYDRQSGRYTLPKLPYAYDALEPSIDATTMRIHHDRHHQGYINGLNNAISQLSEIREGQGNGALIKHWSRELSFHGSGHVNHAMFWSNMAPAGKGGGGEPEGELMKQFRGDFGSYDKFKAHFVAASKSVEGSGWGWLVWEPMAGRLLVLQGEKQQDMMMTGVVPLLGLDVWEHAYYLKYQNKRAEYCVNWFDVVNWPRVAARFASVAG